jgi:hypothetical protein
MKFWELTSAFRSERNNLVSVLSKSKWAKYKINFENLDFIVRQQDRTILDEGIPFQLAKEVCELSNLKFYLYFKFTPHRLTSYKQGDDTPYEEVSPLDILLRFGGSYIEETMERTMSEVMPRKLNDNIEVLGAFNLTQIGMVAFLRTENGKLKDNQVISSLDNLREWTILKEPVMFVDPYSAYMKKECQTEQGIREYIIRPGPGVEKPIEMEILKLKESNTF